MSELPWENKKIAEIMSSAGDEAKISVSPASNVKNDSNPPIPDILANAFVDIPMEEAKIEVPESAPDISDVKMPEISAPPFGDLPDLSMMNGNENKNDGDPFQEITSPSADFPPFMADDSLQPPASKNDMIDSVTKPLFDPGSPIVDGDNSVANAVPNKKRSSPPPLFEPFLSSEDGSDMVPDQGSPMPDADSTNPFDTPPSAETNPFDTPAPDGANPFEVPPSAESNSFDIPAPDGANPFEVPPFAETNPFDIPAPDGANPFEVPPSAENDPFNTPASDGANPFEVPPSAEANPFASSNPFQEDISSKNVSEPESSKTNINVGALKKNIQDLSVVARGFLKNLTKGKSLIERMDDMTDLSSQNSADNGVDNASSISSSPFENDAASPFDAPSANPFQDLPVAEEGPAFPKDVDPFEINNVSEARDDIRTVTPIDDSTLKAQDVPSFEEDIDIPETESISEEMPDHIPQLSDIAEIVPVSSVGKTDIAADEADAFSDDSGMVTRNDGNKADTTGLSEMPDISEDLSSELSAMKDRSDAKFNRLEDNIIDFKDELSSIDMQFDSLRGDVESFSGKISGIDSSFSSFIKANDEVLSQNGLKFSGIEDKINSVEGKIGNFESNLSVLRSDNVSIKSDLSRIEDSVSELVNSYTALLGQLHESLQENESNFSRIDAISVKLDEIGTKIGSMEKVQEGTRSTSMELSRSISSIVDNLGTTSSAFSAFKQESETKNASMLGKIDSVTEYVENELKKLGAKSYKGFGQNVHLSNIVKNSGNMKLCMEWLEFLMGLVGRNNLPDILSYYEELGWITEKVRMELLHYADGIDFYMEKPDWKLTPDDHVKSIWFIESLAGMKVDKNRLSVIERDIEKVKKGSEIYGI